MDKELNSIADDIIKDSFGSSAPSEVPGQAPSPTAPPTTAPSQVMGQPQPQQRPASAPMTSRDPFAAQQRPATPRETFTAEVPTAEPRQVSSRPIPTPRAAQSMPTMPPQNLQNPQKANEYSRIKEQMSAAREASNLPDPLAIPATTNMPKHGLNKTIVLLIILIPILVVTAGVLIALLAQPSASDANNTSNNSQPQYVDPRETATKLDLSTYTSEIELAEAGHYILSGTTTFPVKINAPGAVTLYLNGVSITASDASAISNFSENLLTIVVEDGTENTLAVADPETFDSIYSDGDLTIDGGTGILNVSGIKVAEGRHYDVTGSAIIDSKDSRAEVTETETTISTEIAQPAEGESAFQEGTTPPAEPASTEGQPTEPVDPPAEQAPAEN